MYYINILKLELGSADTFDHDLIDEKYVDDVNQIECCMTTKFGSFVDGNFEKLHMLYWLPKLHKILL